MSERGAEQAFLRERQRLSRGLERVLEEQQGSEFRKRFRDVRRLASGLHSRFRHREQEQLRALLEASDAAQLVEIARALTLSFWLLNLCEERREARERSPGGRGSLAALFGRLRRQRVPRRIVDATLRELRVTLVLTAHPTEAVRWSIHESLERIEALLDVRRESADDELLRELTSLWQTEILRYRAPEPLDEVRHVVHTMAHVLVPAMTAVPALLETAYAAAYGRAPPTGLEPLALGSWVGGDRDGNPHVTAEVTGAALELYRDAILVCYLEELPGLIRELTVSARRVGVSPALRESVERDLAELPALEARVRGRNPEEVYRLKLNAIAVRLEQSRSELRSGERAGARGGFRSADPLLAELRAIESSLRENGGERLAGGRLARLQEMVRIFGLKLAALDVRQHQGRHREARRSLIMAVEGPIESLPVDRQQSFLEELILSDDLRLLASAGDDEVVATLRSVREAQDRFGPDCVRDLVISDTASEIPVLELLLLARHAGLVERTESGELSSRVDLVPLFEEIDALQSAPASMEQLYCSRAYRAQLRARGERQQIMLGYSDSMKDGGYLAACFSLYEVQRELAAQARRHGVRVEFFHGRGGSIARGGGPAHQAILAQPSQSLMGRVKLTEQGEVIAHKYNSVASAVHHLELTLSAALEASLPEGALPERAAAPAVWEETMRELRERSRAEYRSLVYETPGFVDAFYDMTPIEEISELQIGSRPAKRSAARRIEDLRAIAWIFGWNQARVLLPAWYGAGSAFAALLGDSGSERPDSLRRLQRMYGRWPFFRSVIDNLQQVLAKTDLHIASLYAELAGDAGAAVFERIAAEHARTVRAALAIAGDQKLLAGRPDLSRSLALRAPDLDALGYIQVALLGRKRHGAAPDDRVTLTQAIQLTINGVAAGLRNTG